MKNLTIVMAMAVIIFLVVVVSFAQQGPGVHGQRGPGNLMLRIFDANRDGQISEREWTNVFDKIDEDGDGILSTEELEESRRRVREEAGKRIFEKLDADGDGTISKEEFPGPDDRFNKIDSNSDGEVTPEELKGAGEKLRGMREGQHGKMMFKRLDGDGSGTISREEFPGPDKGFAMIDENSDGELSPEELKEAAARRREMMEGNPEMGPGRMFHERKRWNRDPNAVD